MKRTSILFLALLLAFCPALADRAGELAEPYLSVNTAAELAALGEAAGYEITDCLDDTVTAVLLDQTLLVRQGPEGITWIDGNRALLQDPEGNISLMVFPEEDGLDAFREETLAAADPDEFMVPLKVETGETGTVITGVVDDPELVYDLLGSHTDSFLPGDTIAERVFFDANGRITSIERDLVRDGGETLPLSRTGVTLYETLPDAAPMPDMSGASIHTLTWILDPGTDEERAVTAVAPTGMGFTCALNAAYGALWQDAECTIPADTEDTEADITVYSFFAYEDAY